MNNVVIAGAGPSGMLAAISAARNGAQVTLLERNEYPGKKLLATGNGRCNLSNDNLKSLNRDNVGDYYNGSCKDLAVSLLKEFGVDETVAFLSDLGVGIRHRDSLIYPYSDQATAVRDALVMEINALNVDIRLNQKLTGIIKKSDGYEITICDEKTGEMLTEIADSIILTVGSRAYPSFGSDGFGYKLCKKLDININKPLPALCKCMCQEDWLRTADGARWRCRATLFSDEEMVKSEIGEVQFLKDSLSGIVIFNLSSQASRLMDQGKTVSIGLDFFPDYSEYELNNLLSERISNFKAKNYPADSVLDGIFNNRLAKAFIGNENLLKSLKDTRLIVNGVAGFNQAQVCAGGISENEVSMELELKKYPGIYAAGELLDVDGVCGGYNLQFAFSSGYIAGKNAALGKI